MRSTRNPERGATLVESAFALLVFLTIIFGAMEAAILYQAHGFCVWASRDAARWASVRGTASNMQTDAAAVEAYVKRLAVSLDVSKVVVATSFQPDMNPGSMVRVQVSYTVSPVIGYVSKRLFTFRSAAQMMIVR